MKCKRYKIKDLISEISMGPFGSNIKVECFVDSGIPVLNGSNLTGFALNDGSFRYVTEEKANSLGRANAHRGDVVITHRGTLGQIVFIPSDSKFERYVISQSQFRVKCNEKIMPEYLTYYFHTKIGQHKLLSNASQVGVPALARASTTFQELEIEIPPMTQQRKVVSLLETIRVKIELNNAINDNLEQQAQALYSAWFERFTPFNGKMPSDWQVGHLGDIARISTKSFNPAKKSGTKIEHYSIPAFDENRFPVFELSDDIKSNKYIISPNSVLASKLNPDTKRIWRPMCITSNAVCSTEFIVFEAFHPEHKDFVYSIINSSGFSNWMCAHTTGSTNSRQRTTPAKTLEYKIAIPPENAIKSFCSVATPIYDLISENRKENQQLASLRDTLLPKLMSGELDVSTVEL